VDVLEWAIDPWGHRVPIHIAWFLIQVALVSAVAFLIVHAAYVRFFAGEKQWSGTTAPDVAAAIPERVPRHSRVARGFHWLMAASMLTLLFTAFLPKVGVEFDWVTIHWIAGTVLTASVVFHIIHASFWLDFWAIWPDKTDMVDAIRRLRRFFGQPVPAPRRFAKYPFENKGFHASVIAAGLAVIGTGVCMMFRVRTIFFTRNPYLFTDVTWGWMYVLHGLAGVGLIALVVIHIYFGLRPEKRPITKSMIVGWMSRDFVLKEHDPSRWAVTSATAPSSTQERPGLKNAS
jgi:cytochrome b subunit of formate dehydrogenase